MTAPCIFALCAALFLNLHLFSEAMTIPNSVLFYPEEAEGGGSMKLAEPIQQSNHQMPSWFVNRQARRDPAWRHIGLGKRVSYGVDKGGLNFDALELGKEGEKRSAHVKPYWTMIGLG